MALGILGSMGAVAGTEQHMFVGELSLDSSIRPVREALSVAACARRQGIRNLLVPADNAREAAVAEGVSVYGMRHLSEVVRFLADPAGFAPVDARTAFTAETISPVFDFREVRGQTVAKRALERLLPRDLTMS